MSVSTYENVVDVMNYLIFEIETNPKNIDLVPMTYRSNSVEFRKKREREHRGILLLIIYPKVFSE